jgi:transcription initiation factor TFIIIB Brf1 subunit/transcription initiation factor TFIIB
MNCPDCGAEMNYDMWENEYECWDCGRIVNRYKDNPKEWD